MLALDHRLRLVRHLHHADVSFLGTDGKQLIKEMFYLMTHSTHLIYGYMASGHMVKDHSYSERKEGRKCFINDALNTFYLRLYGVGHMLRDHSYSERGNPLSPHGLLFPINSKGYFICTIPQTEYTYHGLWYTSCGALAGTRNSSIGPP